jgi:hypothetical protein
LPVSVVVYEVDGRDNVSGAALILRQEKHERARPE